MAIQTPVKIKTCPFDQEILKPCSRLSCGGCPAFIEAIKVNGDYMICPFSDKELLCGADTCDGCAIRDRADKAEKERYGENLQDLWLHNNNFAERSW